MNKVECALELYTAIVLDIVQRPGDARFHMDDGEQAVQIEKIINQMVTFCLPEESIEFFEDKGITPELLQSFGFLASTSNGLELYVQPILAALKQSPEPGPAVH